MKLKELFFIILGICMGSIITGSIMSNYVWEPKLIQLNHTLNEKNAQKTSVANPLIYMSISSIEQSLKEKKGSDFNELYTAYLSTIFTSAISVSQLATESASLDDVKQFATDSLPNFQNELDQTRLLPVNKTP